MAGASQPQQGIRLAARRRHGWHSHHHRRRSQCLGRHCRRHQLGKARGMASMSSCGPSSIRWRQENCRPAGSCVSITEKGRGASHLRYDDAAGFADDLLQFRPPPAHAAKGSRLSGRGGAANRSVQGARFQQGLIADHLVELFSEGRAKELLITPNGVRIVWLLAEAEQARATAFSGKRRSVTRRSIRP